MKVKVKLDGLRELDTGLAHFKKSTQAGILSRVLKNAAKPVADKARELVPKDTHELENSIAVAVVKSNAGKAAYHEAMVAGATKTEAAAAARAANRTAAGAGAKANVIVGTPLFRAHLTEFGTVKAPAQPFLRPAFNAKSGEVLSVIKAELGREIAATAKRIAKKKVKRS